MLGVPGNLGTGCSVVGCAQRSEEYGQQHHSHHPHASVLVAELHWYREALHCFDFVLVALHSWASPKVNLYRDALKTSAFGSESSCIHHRPLFYVQPPPSIAQQRRRAFPGPSPMCCSGSFSIQHFRFDSILACLGAAVVSMPPGHPAKGLLRCPPFNAPCARADERIQERGRILCMYHGCCRMDSIKRGCTWDIFMELDTIVGENNPPKYPHVI